MWNLEDDQICVRYGNEEGKRIAFQRIYSRTMLNPSGFAALVFEKFSIMWGDDSYGAYWSTLKMDITGRTLQIEQNRMGL